MLARGTWPTSGSTVVVLLVALSQHFRATTVPAMSLMPRPFAAASVQPGAAPSTPLRRCTFRRVSTVARPRELPMYEVACTFPDRKRAVPLGDIESARPICASCTYQGIFRADSD